MTRAHKSFLHQASGSLGRNAQYNVLPITGSKIVAPAIKFSFSSLLFKSSGINDAAGIVMTV